LITDAEVHNERQQHRQNGFQLILDVGGTAAQQRQHEQRTAIQAKYEAENAEVLKVCTTYLKRASEQRTTEMLSRGTSELNIRKQTA